MDLSQELNVEDYPIMHSQHQHRLDGYENHSYVQQKAQAARNQYFNALFVPLLTLANTFDN